MFGGFFPPLAKAPDFPENFEWINTDEPLNFSKLKGNVVVLDFWTCCCINCMHTLPVLAQLGEKYRGQPVMFIGIHSGKFFTGSRRESSHPSGLGVCPRTRSK